MEKKSRPSSFVVEQKGAQWFWLAILPALILGFSFRLFFSEDKVTKELKKAFIRLEPQLKVQFEGARLSLSEGWFWPEFAIHVSNIEGELLKVNKGKSAGVLSFSMDSLKAPISLKELLTGVLALNELDVGYVVMRLQEPSQKILTYFQNLEALEVAPLSLNQRDKSFSDLEGRGNSTHQTQGLQEEDLSNQGADFSVSTLGTESFEENFRPTASRPIEKVFIRSLRVEGPLGELPLELRQLRLNLDNEGRAELNSELSFPVEKWGSQPVLPFYLRWNPEDKFISLSLTGRWREGNLNLSGTFDLAQDFFNIDFKGNYLPSVFFIPFFEKVTGQKIFELWESQEKSEFLSGWISFESSSMGYMLKPLSSQLTVRNFVLEGKNESWEVSQLLALFSNGELEWKPFRVNFKGLPLKKLQLFSFAQNPFFLKNKSGKVSGFVEVNPKAKSSYKIEAESPMIQWQGPDSETNIKVENAQLLLNLKSHFFEAHLSADKSVIEEKGYLFIFSKPQIEWEKSKEGISSSKAYAEIFTFPGWEGVEVEYRDKRLNSSDLSEASFKIKKFKEVGESVDKSIGHKDILDWGTFSLQGEWESVHLDFKKEPLFFKVAFKKSSVKESPLRVAEFYSSEKINQEKKWLGRWSYKANTYSQEDSQIKVLPSFIW